MFEVELELELMVERVERVDLDSWGELALKAELAFKDWASVESVGSNGVKVPCSALRVSIFQVSRMMEELASRSLLGLMLATLIFTLLGSGSDSWSCPWSGSRVGGVILDSVELLLELPPQLMSPKAATIKIDKAVRRSVLCICIPLRLYLKVVGDLFLSVLKNKLR